VSNLSSVTVRPPSVEDSDLLFLLAADLDTWEERTPSAPAPLNRLAFEARLAQTDAETSEKKVRFVIEMDGVAVGTVSLFRFDELAHHAEVGIALIAEARGKGVGTAAISQIVEFAFVRCNLRRLHLQALASNLGAIRAYEKAGFVIEGHQRQHAWVRGVYEDILVMGLLRSEWKEWPGKAALPTI
jgi:RimJ/RimL family protein N-acetyltransferase